MQILRAVNYKVMPWKNGLGSTTEIAISPNRDNHSDFDWRVSMAQVTSDGPFSSFPEIDRTLLVLDGAGIMLTVADCAPVQIDDTSIHSFAGDQPTSASLINGPIVDLNIMSRRGVVQHAVRRIKVMAKQTFLVSPVALLFVETGTLTIRCGTETHEIVAKDTALIDCKILRPEIELFGIASVALIEFRR